MSSATRETFSMPLSPPLDLSTYSRSMLQHTKRQMEAASSTSSRGSTSPDGQSGGGPSAMPNGVSSSRRNPSQYSYGS